MKSDVRLFHNSFWGAVSAIFRMISSVTVVMLLVSIMGAASFGVVTIITTVTGILILVNTGLYATLIRRLIHARQESRSDVSVLIVAGRLFTLISIVVMLAIYVSGKGILAESLYIGDEISVSYEEFSAALDLAVLVVIVRAVIGYISALLEGFGRFALAAKLQMCSPSMLLLTISAFALFGIDLSINAYFPILLGSVIAELVLSMLFLAHTGLYGADMGYLSMKPLRMLPSLLRDSLYLQTASILSMFVDPLNKLVVHAYVGPVGVASYEVAMRIIVAVRGIFSSAFRSFMQLSPDPTNAGVQYGRLMGYVFNPALILHLLMLMAMGAALTLGVPGIPLDSLYLSMIVLPTSMAIVSVSPLYSLLLGLGDYRYIVLLHFRLALFNAIGAIIFIPVFGVLGSAFALALATFYNAYSVHSRINSEYTRTLGVKDMVSVAGWPAAISIALAIGSLYLAVGMGGSASMLGIGIGMVIQLWLLWREPFIRDYLVKKIMSPK